MADLKKIDFKKIDDAIQLGMPITITTYTFSHAVQSHIEKIVNYFLEHIEQAHLKDYAMYCLNELAVNAKKANTKRVYFKELGLDIQNTIQYRIGMDKFKKETLERIDFFLNMQEKEGLYIKIVLSIRSNNFEIEIRNNCIMTREEHLRINEKITMAATVNDFSEVMSDVVDETEGAGLGIIIMLLMLKQIGASHKCFSVEVSKTETISKISLPFSADYNATIKDLSDTIVKQINEIPQFPEKILQLQKMINDTDSTISDIARTISADVGITADLLKLVNSAAFGLKQKCNNIAEAVKLIGIRGISNLLYSIGTVNVFAEIGNEDEQNSLWEHAYKCAYFSYNLARVLRLHSVIDDAYVCGLLHDIGKLVFSGLYPNTLQILYKIQKKRNIPQNIINAITSGIQHAEIGARLTEKWSFPSQITQAILYHHNIDDVDEQYLHITATVSLANYLVHYSEGLLDFDQIPIKVLKIFNIDNEDVLKKLSSTFTKGFENERNR
ncbi:MAG: HDOD domain-containing protein [Spirochaetaceae bacterium]|nr:HDOD domain-containing protein [Spirochaetaceae bacterium]